jgi:hypothetical protein
MKPFLKEEIIDIILISPDRVIYYDFDEKENSVILKNLEVFKTPIYENGVFLKNNLEKALDEIIKKYKIKELGISLHFPNIFFQKVTIPRTPDALNAIKNYLQNYLPLNLEKYKIIYKEDVYKLSGNFANYNVFLFPKELEEEILDFFFKEDVTLYFVSPSFEAILSNLLYEALISFTENYLIFFIDEKIAHIFYLENLKPEKIFFEEVSQETNFDLFIERFINYFTSQDKKFETLIFAFPEIQIKNYNFVKINPYEFIGKGNIVLLKKIFQDQPFLDFLSLKPKTVYFLNKIKRSFNLSTIFIFSVTLISLLTLVYFYFDFSNKEKALKEEIQKMQRRGNISEIKSSLDYLTELKGKIEEKEKEKKLDVLISLINRGYEVESYDFQRREMVFKVSKDKIEDFKKEVQGLNIREETAENYYRVILTF